MVSYAQTTENITVTVRPGYLDGRSDLINKQFVFGYAVEIKNRSARPVQLLRRHWIIKESSGRIEEVEGEGVLGIQPIIPPGQSHQYSSFCILHSFTGSMEGTYLMQDFEGRQFQIQIPRFTLQAAAN